MKEFCDLSDLKTDEIEYSRLLIERINPVDYPSRHCIGIKPEKTTVVSVTLGGSAQLGQGYSCGKFDPVAAVPNTLNDIGAGIDNMMSAMTAAASAAIAALPALILQRANPGLYDLFQVLM
jgi:hypothetical protein